MKAKCQNPKLKCQIGYVKPAQLGALCLLALLSVAKEGRKILKKIELRRSEMLIIMANTYSQIYVQIVFAVKGRQNLIKQDFKEELHKYITGIVKNKKQKLLAINCMPDHTHLFVGFTPDICISDLVRDIKSNSTGFINDKKFIRGKFRGSRVLEHFHIHILILIRLLNMF